MGVIYLRTNLVTGMQYVGKAEDFKRRERDWRCLKWRYANQLLTDEREKYGLENFTVEILEECDNSRLNELERIYIEKYNTIYPDGYNDNEGGDIGFHHSERTKKKISYSNKVAAKKRMDELIEQLKPYQYKKGNKPWNYGVEGCYSEETRRKMSQSAKNKPPISEETKQKMSESRKGVFLNKNGKTVYQYTLDGDLVATYSSRNEAGRAIGVRGTSIGNCCNGGFYNKKRGKWVNMETIKGYRWSYEPL